MYGHSEPREATPSPYRGDADGGVDSRLSLHSDEGAEPQVTLASPTSATLPQSAFGEGEEETGGVRSRAFGVSDEGKNETPLKESPALAQKFPCPAPHARSPFEKSTAEGRRAEKAPELQEGSATGQSLLRCLGPFDAGGLCEEGGFVGEEEERSGKWQEEEGLDAAAAAKENAPPNGAGGTETQTSRRLPSASGGGEEEARGESTPRRDACCCASGSPFRKAEFSTLDNEARRLAGRRSLRSEGGGDEGVCNEGASSSSSPSFRQTPSACAAAAKEVQTWRCTSTRTLRLLLQPRGPSGEATHRTAESGSTRSSPGGSDGEPSWTATAAASLSPSPPLPMAISSNALDDPLLLSQQTPQSHGNAASSSNPAPARDTAFHQLGKKSLKTATALNESDEAGAPSAASAEDFLEEETSRKLVQKSQCRGSGGGADNDSPEDSVGEAFFPSPPPFHFAEKTPRGDASDSHTPCSTKDGAAPSSFLEVCAPTSSEATSSSSSSSSFSSPPKARPPAEASASLREESSSALGLQGPSLSAGEAAPSPGVSREGAAADASSPGRESAESGPLEKRGLGLWGVQTPGVAVPFARPFFWSVQAPCLGAAALGWSAVGFCLRCRELSLEVWRKSACVSRCCCCSGGSCLQLLLHRPQGQTGFFCARRSGGPSHQAASLAGLKEDTCLACLNTGKRETPRFSSAEVSNPSQDLQQLLVASQERLLPAPPLYEAALKGPAKAERGEGGGAGGAPSEKGLCEGGPAPEGVVEGCLSEASEGGGLWSAAFGESAHSTGVPQTPSTAATASPLSVLPSSSVGESSSGSASPVRCFSEGGKSQSLLACGGPSPTASSKAFRDAPPPPSFCSSTCFLQQQPSSADAFSALEGLPPAALAGKAKGAGLGFVPCKSQQPLPPPPGLLATRGAASSSSFVSSRAGRISFSEKRPSLGSANGSRGRSESGRGGGPWWKRAASGALLSGGSFENGRESREALQEYQQPQSSRSTRFSPRVILRGGPSPASPETLTASPPVWYGALSSDEDAPSLPREGLASVCPPSSRPCSSTSLAAAASPCVSAETSTSTSAAKTAGTRVLLRASSKETRLAKAALVLGEATSASSREGLVARGPFFRDAAAEGNEDLPLAPCVWELSPLPLRQSLAQGEADAAEGPGDFGGASAREDGLPFLRFSSAAPACAWETSASSSASSSSLTGAASASAAVLSRSGGALRQGSSSAKAGFSWFSRGEAKTGGTSVQARLAGGGARWNVGIPCAAQSAGCTDGATVGAGLSAVPVRTRKGFRKPLPLPPEMVAALASAPPDTPVEPVLQYDGETREWRVFWQEEPQARYKVFQSKKFGKERAQQLAEEWLRRARIGSLGGGLRAARVGASGSGCQSRPKRLKTETPFAASPAAAAPPFLSAVHSAPPFLQRPQPQPPLPTADARPWSFETDGARDASSPLEDFQEALLETASCSSAPETEDPAAMAFSEESTAAAMAESGHSPSSQANLQAAKTALLAPPQTWAATAPASRFSQEPSSGKCVVETAPQQLTAGPPRGSCEKTSFGDSLASRVCGAEALSHGTPPSPNAPPLHSS